VIPFRGSQAVPQARRHFERVLAAVPHRYLVCAGSGCVSNGSLRVLEALRGATAAGTAPIRASEAPGEGESGSAGAGLTSPVTITGCHGFCAKGPLVRVEPHGMLCTGVRPEHASALVQAFETTGQPPADLLYRDPLTGQPHAREHDVPFYRHQIRVTLQNCGVIDPEDIRTYIARGGYGALTRCLFDLTPDDAVAAVSASRLRGRGGAGYLTGRKWEQTRAQAAERRFVVCNGDEGDPGAFMDRSIMEGDPHAVIEGMLIAGFAIGASEGYVYVRHEYPLAVGRLARAVAEASHWGLLGPSVLGTGFAFQIHIREGAGAFVSGEETALLRSIQGERATPYMRPPYPSERGLWGAPTCINNVETLATVPLILARGPEWYAGLGTPASGGTKVFALTGAIQNTGLVEVPLGTPLRHIVENIGGGARPGRQIKAVQIGGPSGGCLPAPLMDTPVDYEELQATGAIMGSGGLVVADDATCMVDLARFFLSFTQDESCGKCVPCRIGTRKMLGMLERITRGEGRPEDPEDLERLAQTVCSTSLCGLGRTAPNPVLTTLRYFRDEFDAHIHDRRCPAGACAALR
jgi:NADH-quinone oxidoreductase subunit F